MLRGAKHTSIPNGLGTAMHTECHVVYCIILPCGLGYQQLEPYHTAFSSDNSTFAILLWVGSHHA